MPDASPSGWKRVRRLQQALDAVRGEIESAPFGRIHIHWGSAGFEVWVETCARKEKWDDGEI